MYVHAQVRATVGMALWPLTIAVDGGTFSLIFLIAKNCIFLTAKNCIFLTAQACIFIEISF